MPNTHDVFINVIKQCFNYLDPIDVLADINVRLIIQNIWDESDNPKNAEITAREYLSIPPFSYEGHARLRQMMIYMSEYMDKHNIEKGETFKEQYKQLVEMVKPDGRSNVEEYYKTHDTAKYEHLMIRNIEHSLDGVETNIRRAFRLSNELGTKNGEYTVEKLNKMIQQLLNNIYYTMLNEKAYGEKKVFKTIGK